MTSCDADIDWDSNKEEIIVANKGEEWQESDDDDSPLEKDNKEEASDNDDMVYDFTCVHHWLSITLTYSSLFLYPKLPWNFQVRGKWIERYYHEILDQKTVLGSKVLVA